MRTERRLSVIDGQWAGHWSCMIVGPITAPSVAAVRQLLTDHLAASPESALASIPDPARGVWVTVPATERAEHVARMVVAGPAPEPGGLAAHLATYAAPKEQLTPLHVVVSPSHLTISLLHLVGDALTFTWVVAALANLDPEGLRRLEPRVTMRAVVRGTLHQARMVGPWTRQVRSRRTPQSSPAPAVPDAGRQPEPWSQGFSCEVLDNRALRALTSWRNEHHPGVAVSAVLAAALHRALCAQGLAIDGRGFNMLFDVRPWLAPADQQRMGNLAKSLFVPVEDMSDPAQVFAAQQSLSGSGWPLPGLVTGALLARGHRGRVVPPATEVPPAGAVMTLSVMPSLPGVTQIPWTTPRSGNFVGGGYPSGADSINVFALRLRHHMELCASFSASTFDPDAVGRALRSVGDVEALFAS